MGQLPGETLCGGSGREAEAQAAAAESTALVPCLPTRPGGVALLEERGHPFLGVVRLRIRGHHAAGQLVGAVLVELDLLVERPLADAEREWARAGDLRRQLENGAFELLRRD